MTLVGARQDDVAARDKRFSNTMWDDNPYFRFLRQQYENNAEAIAQAVASTEGLDEKDKQRLLYFSQQIVDMMAPINFLSTNPDALEKAVENKGQSLIRGL